MICGLSVLDSFAGSSDTTVVLARCNAASMSARNRVCSIELADIDSEMDRKYTQCTTDRTGEIVVAWDSGTERQCATDFQVSTCTFYNNETCSIILIRSGHDWGALLCSTGTGGM